MIRFLFRFIGFWLLAGGFVALIVDGTRSIAASSIVLTATGDAWYALSPGSLAAAQVAAKARSAFLWDHVATPLLTLPVFAVLIFLGVVFMTIGRVRERSRFEVA